MRKPIGQKTKSKLGERRVRSCVSRDGCRTTILSHATEIAAIESEVDREIADAVAFAERGTLEAVEEVERFVVMKEVPE